jgi:transcriptional regulator with XRE-family HTH domain
VPRTLGEALREGRDRAGLSLRDVERLTGIHNAHVSQIEKGRIEQPDVWLLFELARACDLDFVELLDLAGYVAHGDVQPQAARAMTSAALRAVGGLGPADQMRALRYIQTLDHRERAADATLSHESRRRISAMAERALLLADLDPDRATPLDDVARVSGVAARLPIADLPDQVRLQKPKLWKRILGAVVFDERLIYVDTEQSAPRARFTEAHEIAHMLLPWHAETFRLDDEQRIFYGVADVLELEANWAAATLIFQGNRYHERALDDRPSIATPIDLASRYDASIHASIRYYVERHPDDVAGLVAGRYPQYDGSLPIWTTFASASFAERFGSLADHLSAPGLPLHDEEFVLGRLAHAALTSGGAPADQIELTGLDDRRRRFTAEAFFNQYSTFVLLTPRHRVAGGRRTKVVRRTSA